MPRPRFEVHNHAYDAEGEAWGQVAVLLLLCVLGLGLCIWLGGVW